MQVSVAARPQAWPRPDLMREAISMQSEAAHWRGVIAWPRLDAATSPMAATPDAAQQAAGTLWNL